MDSKEILRQTIEQPFNGQKFRQFVADFLNDYNSAQSSLAPLYPSFSEHINQFNLLGEYQDAQGKNIHILEVELKNTHKLESARTVQRNLVAKYLEDNWLDGALVGFWAPDSPRWRFSFVKLTWEFDKENKKTKKILSPAKRYSFLIGEGEPSHTPQSQLLPVLEQEINPTLEQVEEAFSVERVTKEFYQEYKKLFDTLCEVLDKNRVFQGIKETKRIDTANFAKKLLGQIVFLYFIQKKGWLGVAMDKKWGEGDRAFLRHLFEKAKDEDRNFFNDYLEVLFYDTLNKKPDLPGSFYRKYFGAQIPFLNGGLFEPMKGYNWENSLLLLDNELFSNSEGKGILDVFNRYNFTVKEDEPLEKEVAVDPEMLGKVFENLLEEILRKSKGTYFTPREIVHYMCRESLVNYLASESKMDPEDIREYFKFMETAMPVIDGYIENFEKLDNLLNNIRVCDPACGSGAFLVGMLQDIVKLRLFLQSALNPKEKLSEYQFKKETIQNCIYGVDIDPGAIEIAKLRLWLSLVVDYELEEIEPLPNLDYKIMQGNSLLEELVLGDTTIKLFDPDLVIKRGKKMKNLFEEEKQKDLFEQKSATNKAMQQLDELRKRYFEISDLPEKLKVKKEIEGIEQELVQGCVEREIRRLDIRLKNIGKYIAPGVGLTKEDAEKIAKIVSIQGQIMQMYQKFEESKVRPYFLWHLYFADVFQKKGGFDVVIANPPYVRQEEIKEQKPLLVKVYQVFNSTSDLYTYFYELSFNILASNRFSCFISSNKWMRAKYGEKLRRFLKENTKVMNLVDFGGHKVFEATVDTNILLFQKGEPQKDHCLPYVNIAPDFTGGNLDNYVRTKQQTIKQYELSDSGWTLADDKVLALKKKIEKIGTPLKDWDIRICFGIKTGFNEAFIITNETKERFCKEDPKSAEILKPILRGRDIGRYYYKWAGLWLIKIESRWTNENRGKENAEIFFKKKYPAVYKHLITFAKTEGKGKGLFNRDDQGDYWWELRDCDYYGEFEQEKIVYPDIAGKLTFAYEDKKYFLNNTGYFLNVGDKYLLAVLNSLLTDFYYRQISSQLGNKAVRAFTVFIERLPIPIIDEANQKPFIDLADKILDITKSSDYFRNEAKQKKVKEYENQIDQLVYKLYGLTPQEIKIVEKGVNKK